MKDLEELEGADPLAVIFVFRILTILNEANLTNTEEGLTKEQIYDVYVKTSPPNRFKDALKNVFRKESSITRQKLDLYLKFLTEKLFITQKIQSWRNDPSSKVKMIVYVILDKGRDVLNLKGSKKR